MNVTKEVKKYAPEDNLLTKLPMPVDLPVKVSMRFNTQHNGGPLRWRLFIDTGLNTLVERPVSLITFDGRTQTETFFNEQGELKGNIWCMATHVFIDPETQAASVIQLNITGDN